MEEKKCPLLLAGENANGEELYPAYTNCRGSACAWYDAAADRCAVLTLAKQLRNQR